jgi:hypothetical protein
MSELMLDDEKTINDINPFVLDPPGSSRKPNDIVKPIIIKEESMFDNNEGSPICDYAVANNLAMCEPSVKNCPLNRPLHPMRNIDVGFTKKFNKVKTIVEKNTKPNYAYMVIIIFLLSLIIFLMY